MTASAEPNKERSSRKGGKKGEYYEESDKEWKDLVPHCIFFYYFTKKLKGPGYDNKFYFFDRGDATPIDEEYLRDTKIPALVENAYSGGNNPAPMSTKFGGQHWNRISWLVVAVLGDEFGSKKAVEIKKNGGDGKNHSFFDGKEKVVQLGGETIGVMWAQNHMRDADGKLLTKESPSDEFYFRFKSKRAAFFQIDESGTNTGPTVVPPPSPPPPPPPLGFKGKDGTGRA